MFNDKLTTALIAAGIALSLTGLTGCRSSKGDKQQKPAKLTILSDRGVIPPPYRAPQDSRRQTRLANTMPPVSVGCPGSPQQPQLPGASDEAVFVPPATTDALSAPTFPPAFHPVPKVAPSNAPAPVTPPTPETPPPPKKTYTVVKGDSLSIIAYMYKVSWRDIASENNLTEKSVIRPGQVLTLPQGAAETPRQRPVIKKRHTPSPSPKKDAATHSNSPKGAPAGKSRAPEKIPADGFYTVVSGDNLYNIVRRFKVKEATVRKLNPDIHNFDRLQIGQRIRLRDTGVSDENPPTAPETGTTTPPAPALNLKPAQIPASSDIPNQPGEVDTPKMPGLPAEVIPTQPAPKQAPVTTTPQPAQEDTVPAPLAPPQLPAVLPAVQ